MFFGTNFGAPAAAASPVARVQRALSLLALAKGDASLGVKVDGATGPQTAAAVNKALTKYAPNAPNAPAALRTGKLTPAQVKQNAAVIATEIERAAQKLKKQPDPSGRLMPTSVVPAKAVSKSFFTNVAAKAAGFKPAPPPKARASRAQLQKLQLAVRALGAKTGDKSLAIGADGIVGPQTLIAVNKAVKSHGVFSRQVSGADLADPSIVSTITMNLLAKASAVSKPVPAAPAKQTPSPTVRRLQQAIAAYGKIPVPGYPVRLQIKADGRTGPETRTALYRVLNEIYGGIVGGTPIKTQYTDVEIVQNAESLAKAVEQEIARRGAAPPARPKSAPPPGMKRSSAITQIQQSLGQLGKLANDVGLVVVVDGITGPKTAAAVNRAMLKYVRSGPASIRTGKLSVAQVSANAAAIINALGVEITRRGQPQEAAPPTPQPSPEPENTAPPEQETPAEAEASVPEQMPPEPSLPEAPTAAQPAPSQSFAPDAPVPTQYVPQAEQTSFLPENEAPPAPAFQPEYIPPQQQTPAQFAPMPSYAPPSYASESPSEMPQAMMPSEALTPSAVAPPPTRKAAKWPLYAGIGLGAVTLAAVGYFAFRPKKSYRR